jgi:Ca2+-transporting ATPase
MDPGMGKEILIGSKTETALLKFAQELGWPDFKKTRDNADIVQMLLFSSERKAMGVVIQKESGKRYRAYFKNVSEILLKKCTRHVVTMRPPQGEKFG